MFRVRVVQYVVSYYQFYFHQVFNSHRCAVVPLLVILQLSSNTNVFILYISIKPLYRYSTILVVRKVVSQLIAVLCCVCMLMKCRISLDCMCLFRLYGSGSRLITQSKLRNGDITLELGRWSSCRIGQSEFEFCIRNIRKSQSSYSIYHLVDRRFSSFEYIVYYQYPNGIRNSRCSAYLTESEKRSEEYRQLILLDV